MRKETVFLWKVFLGTAAAIIFVGLVFFNVDNLLTWMSLDNPFQAQWAVVQLSDGEILYGHFSGVTATTIGLTDVYLLDKVTPEPTSTDATSSSTGLILGATTGASSAPAGSTVLIPVSDTPKLFINRTAVLYFKYVPADDPALPYLH